MKQKTLAGFVTKKIVHRGEEQEISIPEFAEGVEPKYECGECKGKYKTPQALSIHTRAIHNIAYVTNKSTKQSTKSTQQDINFSSSSKDSESETEIAIQDAVKNVLSKLVENVGKKFDPPIERQNYTAQFKAKVVYKREWSKASFRVIGDIYKIDHSLVVRWVQNKVGIYADAADKIRRNLKKGRKAKKCNDLYKKLYTTFKCARDKGHRVDFHWLWSKAKAIHRENTGEESAKLGKHVIDQFLHKYKVRMRAKQRNKSKPKESFRDPLMKWHCMVRESFVRTRRRDGRYDEKWGAFMPSERFNVDQSPLPFVIKANTTYEIVPEGEGRHQHNTWISQPGAGLDKRQCSLQVRFIRKYLMYSNSGDKANQ